jgi:NAD(P)-dependent dehydrogenase (short-subunit alcohol dehydrogenase family)
MRIRLDGRCVLVTGGTRGVGRATSLSLARAGARVVAVHRDDDEDPGGLAEEPGWTGGGNSVLRADPRDTADRERIVARCRERVGGIDILVNNMGSTPLPWDEIDVAGIEETVSANLTMHVLLTREMLPLVRDGGSIVNVGAAMAARGRAGHAHLTAAKAGLHGFTRSLARDVGHRGIRVNTVATSLVENERGGPLPEPVREQIRRAVPLRRLSTAEDVANLVTFLASDLSGFVNGTEIGVDGGL